MSYVGIVLNLYLEFEDTKIIDVDVFNKQLIKSSVISIIILIIIVLMNKKKIL